MSDAIPYVPRDTSDETRPAAAWSLAQRVLFRCAFPYLVLTSLLWIFEFADKSTALAARPFQAVWRPLVLWTSVHIFHWGNAVALNFVRDTRYLYALLFCFLVFSIVTALVWSLLDRRRTEYLWLDSWLRIDLRYVLVYLLLHYGMDKVFLLQFPAPSFARLTERVGDYSPSSLMWTFIGASTVYTVFGGVAEILGAVLLLFRRTTTLGALIAFAVMFNVTVMDFSYDVAVKLLCLHILLMAIYLILPDAGRLLNFFVLNRSTQPASLGFPRKDRRMRPIFLAIKVCLILYLGFSITWRDWRGYRDAGAGAPHVPLYGLYEVERYTLDGVLHPPVLTDGSRWRYVMLETPGKLAVRHMDDSLTEYPMHYDAGLRQMQVDLPGTGARQSSFTIVPTLDGLQFDGSWAGTPLQMSLRSVDRSSFTLVSRGFHWISESGFIR